MNFFVASVFLSQLYYEFEENDLSVMATAELKRVFPNKKVRQHNPNYHWLSKLFSLNKFTNFSTFYRTIMLTKSRKRACQPTKKEKKQNEKDYLEKWRLQHFSKKLIWERVYTQILRSRELNSLMWKLGPLLLILVKSLPNKR